MCGAWRGIQAVPISCRSGPYRREPVPAHRPALRQPRRYCRTGPGRTSDRGPAYRSCRFRRKAHDLLHTFAAQRCDIAARVEIDNEDVLIGRARAAERSLLRVLGNVIPRFLAVLAGERRTAQRALHRLLVVHARLDRGHQHFIDDVAAMILDAGTPCCRHAERQHCCTLHHQPTVPHLQTPLFTKVPSCPFASGMDSHYRRAQLANP